VQMARSERNHVTQNRVATAQQQPLAMDRAMGIIVAMAQQEELRIGHVAVGIVASIHQESSEADRAMDTSLVNIRQQRLETDHVMGLRHALVQPVTLELSPAMEKVACTQWQSSEIDRVVETIVALKK